MGREVSAFFDERYPVNARKVSSTVELPDGWVLTISFERCRDNRGEAYTVYCATRVRGAVVLGEEHEPYPADSYDQATIRCAGTRWRGFRPVSDRPTAPCEPRMGAGYFSW